jgi:DNA-binding NtrC family response regulator
MPGLSGLDILRHLKQKMPSLQIIMLTGQNNPAIIVEAIKSGASDYVVKGTEDFLESLRARIAQAMNIVGAERDKNELLLCLKKEVSKFDILGISPAVTKMRSDISKYKGTSATVLIIGENGTGKELVARNFSIQENKPSRPFIEVNCGGIPENLFESELFGHVKGAFTNAFENKVGKFALADGGDIFLDEIGDLPLEMQVKLLRVLQEKTFTAVGSNRVVKVDCRVIAATNRNLEDLVREGKFREDLFYRLNQIVIRVPPLRDRPEDILFLAKIFSQKFMPGTTLTKEAKIVLENHRWGGNIRELKNTVERACLLARGEAINKIQPSHIILSSLSPGEQSITLPSDLLPTDIDELSPDAYLKSLAWMERNFLKKGLEITGDDNQKLMKLLGLSKTVYYEKKKALGLMEKQRGTVA